ncbi:MAG: NAD(P)/FAD-dependent oxidoreductase [Candidatus Bathyarchaeia archaeon]
MKRKFNLVVLGGGVAGATAAYAAALKSKSLKKRFSIALVSNEGTVYSRSALPSIIAHEVSSLKPITVYPISNLRRANVNFLRRCQILQVDFNAKSVKIEDLRNGEKSELFFENLIIATGSLPKLPPVKGADLRGTYAMKWFDKAKELSRRAKPGMKALIVGAGLIGMETANALMKRGLHVTVAEALPHILSGVLEPSLSRYVQAKAERMGVKIMVQCQLGDIEGKKNVESVTLNGKRVPFDFVIFCTGVKPNTALFANSGLEMAEYGAIKADSKMQTNIEDVYAVGDCAEKIDYVTKRPVYRPLGSLAARTAEIAGMNALGAGITFEGSIRHQYDYVFGVHISSMGLSSSEASALGLKTKTLFVKMVRNEAFAQESLKVPRDSKICVIVDKKTDRIVGWQSVGSSKPVSYYNIFVDDLIKRGGTVGELQETGLDFSR